MTLRLSPFSREAKSNSHKAEADNHVPGADIWDRKTSLSHIEDDDPEETDQEVSDHHRGQPARALKQAVWLGIVD